MQIKIKKHIFRCESCGASEFIYQNHIATCEYCNSQYTIEDATPGAETATPIIGSGSSIQSTLANHKVNPSSTSQSATFSTMDQDIRRGVGFIGKLFLIIIVVVFIISGLVATLGGRTFHQSSMTIHTGNGIGNINWDDTFNSGDLSDFIVGSSDDAYDYIDLVGSWTRQIYDEIQVAQRITSVEETTYAHGDTFTSLVERVGRPNETSYWTFSGTTERTAIWNTSMIEPFYVSIMITYDEASDYIIRKNVSGFSNLFGEDHITSAALGLRHIDEVPGWSEDIFQSIEVATRHWGDFSGDMTFTDGGDFEELEARVGRAPEIFTNTDGTSTASWWSNSDQMSVSISITFEQRTGMITDKSIWGSRW